MRLVKSFEIDEIKKAVERLDDYLFKNTIRIKRGLRPKNGWGEYMFYHGKFIAYVSCLQLLRECREECDYFTARRTYYVKTEGEEIKLKMRPYMQRFSGLTGKEIKPLNRLFKEQEAQLRKIRKCPKK